MKQFIVLAACLPLLLLFVSQYALDQKNEALIAFSTNEVEACLEVVRKEGVFSAEAREDLRTVLSEKLGVEKADIQIEAPETVVYRVNYFDSRGERGLIPYRIEIPIGKAMATGLFSLSGNKRILVLEGTLASEKLP